MIDPKITSENNFCIVHENFTVYL